LRHPRHSVCSDALRERGGGGAGVPRKCVIVTSIHVILCSFAWTCALGAVLTKRHTKRAHEGGSAYWYRFHAVPTPKTTHGDPFPCAEDIFAWFCLPPSWPRSGKERHRLAACVGDSPPPRSDCVGGQEDSDQQRHALSLVGAGCVGGHWLLFGVQFGCSCVSSLSSGQAKRPLPCC
jgi:hypothetical protein